MRKHGAGCGAGRRRHAGIGAAQRRRHAGAAPPAPRGRPWVKGQSGNPRGRPSRAHKAAYVAHALFDRKTAELVDRAIGWGQGGDKAMLRMYLQRMVPPRTEAPVWLNVPPIENRDDVRRALLAVANGVAQGDIASAQGERLVRLLTEIYRFI